MRVNAAVLFAASGEDTRQRAWAREYNGTVFISKCWFSVACFVYGGVTAERSTLASVAGRVALCCQAAVGEETAKRNHRPCAPSCYCNDFDCQACCGRAS